MFSSVIKKYRNIYSSFMALLMLAQSFVPAFFVFLPSNAYAMGNPISISQVEFSLNNENKFDLSIESSEDLSYLITYIDKSSQIEKAIKGKAVSNGVRAEISEFAGICSYESCVEDEVVSGSLILSENNFESDFVISNNQLWLAGADSATIYSVRVGETYAFPLENEVRVTFTKLPENPGSLTIQRIELTDEQVETVGAVGNIAYDITSSMENGSFEYDLKLPVPEGVGKNAQIVYAENLSDLGNAENVEEIVNGNEVAVDGLDHFTIFIITDDQADYSAPWIDYATQGYLDTGVHYPTNVNAGETATWDFSALTPGNYSVYVSWSTDPNRTTVAPYDLTHASGTMHKEINQEQLADQSTTGTSAQWSGWHYYGGYDLNTASKLVLTGVENSSRSEYVIADEVMLVNTSHCSWSPSNDPNSPTFGVDCQGSVQGRTFVDQADNGLLLSADGDYSVGMEDDFAIRVYGQSWNLIEEQTTRTTSRVGQYNVTGLLNESTTYRVCGVQRDGYLESVPGIGQHVVSTSGGNIPSKYADAVIVANGSSASDEFSRCWETTLDGDNGAYLGVGYVVDVAPAIPTGLKFLNADGNEYQCNDFSLRQVSVPMWDDNSEIDFDHYEYSSFHPSGAQGLNEKVLYVAKLQNSWMPPTDGAYGFAVRAVDTAGNKSAWALIDETLGGSCQINYDSEAPTTPQILGFTSPSLSCGAITTIHSTTVDWTDSSDLGSGFDKYEYNIDYPKPNGTRGNWTTFLSPSQYGGSLNEGIHNVRVRAVDVLGNTSDWSNTCSITTDWTAPDAPTLIEPTNNSVVNGATLLSDWSTISDADHYIYESYHDAGATNLRWHAEYTASEKGANNVANSTFWWRVKAVDAAGNESEWSDLWKVAIDNDSPNVAVTNPVAGIVSGTVDIRGTVEDDNPHHYWFVVQNSSNTTVAGPGVVNDTNSFTDQSLLSWDTTTVPDGIYKIKLEARDAANNKDSGSVSWIEVIVDNTSPSSVITTFDLADGGETQTATFSGLVEGTATDGSGSGIDHVLLSISHLEFGADESETKYWDATGSAWINLESTFRAVGTTLWSYQLADVPEGIYNVTSHAVDLAGNVEATYTIKIVFDKTIPEVLLAINPTSPDGSNGWYKTNPSITLVASDNYLLDHIEYQWNSTAGTWTTYSSSFNPPGEGQNILYYRSIDTVGNTSDLGIKEVKYDETNPGEGPLSVRVENIRSTTAVGKWEKPENDDDINDYKLSWKHKETGTEYSATVDSNIFEHDLDNLFDGFWELKVSAVDSAGNKKSASTEFRVGSDPNAILGASAELNDPAGTSGLVAGVYSEDQTSDDDSFLENEEGDESKDDGQVAGAIDDNCMTWEFYLPILLLILQAASIILIEVLNRKTSLKKILTMLGISLLSMALFYWLRNPECYGNGGAMSFFNKWFVISTLGLFVLIKFAASISIEDK